jgi:hypothetical protein
MPANLLGDVNVNVYRLKKPLSYAFASIQNRHRIVASFVLGAESMSLRIVLKNVFML